MRPPKHPTHPSMPARLIGISYSPVKSRYDVPLLHLVWEFPHDGLCVHSTYNAYLLGDDAQSVAIRALSALWTSLSPVVEQTDEDPEGILQLSQTFLLRQTHLVSR